MNPIDSYDMKELIIQKEITSPIEVIGIENGATILVDNKGNTAQNPTIIITLKDVFISGFTVTNTTTGRSVVIVAPEISFAEGTIIKIYSDSVYADNIEVDATFSAPFIIAEDRVNTLLFTLPTGFLVDVSVSWLHPSNYETTITFVNGFQFHEVRSQKQGGVNVLNKYSSNAPITQAINGDFSIDKMLRTTWFEDENDYTYRLKWQTDSEVGDINQQSYVFCNCRFNDISWSQQNDSIISEQIKGVYGKRIKVI